MRYFVIAELPIGDAEIHHGESFPGAKIMADNYKRDTGHNCRIESRSEVYTTQTLDEAMQAAGLDPRRPIEFRPGDMWLNRKTGNVWTNRAVGDHGPEWSDYLG